MPLFNRESPNSPAPVPDDYAGRLAFIGKQLDEASCHSAVVVEISGSFIVRAVQKRSGEIVMSEVVPDDFQHGYDRKSPDVGSYEAMFAEIGQDLDRRIAANIAILEREQVFETVGWVHGTAAGRSTYIPVDRAYLRRDLQFKAAQRR